MTIHLLNYNNYFNRQVKRQSNWSTDYAKYLANLGALENPIDNVNFVPGDEVNTTIDLQIPDDIGMPDYLLVTDPALYGSGTTDIVSRWFVIEAERQRGAFWRLSLYRDTIADFYYQIWNDPMMVHRGMLSAEDQFIYRRQPGNFNQIKKDQISLWDDSGCGWIVGYISREALAENSATLQVPPIAPDSTLPYDMTVSQFQSLYPGALNNTVYRLDTLRTQIIVTIAGATIFEQRNFYIQTGLSAQGDVEGYVLPAPEFVDHEDIVSKISVQGPDRETLLKKAIVQRLDSQINYKNSLMTLSENRNQLYDNTLYQKLKELGTITLFDQSTGIYYKLNKSTVNNFFSQLNPNGQFLSELPYDPQFSNIQTAYKNALPLNWQEQVQLNGENFSVGGIQFRPIQLGNIKLFLGTNGIQLTKVALNSPNNITATIPAAPQRIHCKDQPFDIFTVPYYTSLQETSGVQKDSSNNEYKINSEIARALVQNLPSILGTTVYDIQLLPYCPLQVDRYDSDLNIKVGSEYGDTPIKQGDTTIGWISWVRSSNANGKINIGLATEEKAINIKVQGTTSFARLVSPNYSSMFQFNYTKNKGINSIYWYMTLRPFNPWIKVVPEWDGLYARPSSLYDAEGLILGGDFSLAQPTDAWANYQLSHKNYLSVFDRELKSLETQQQAGMLTATVGAGMGVIMGAAHGGIAGAAAAAVTGGVGLASKAVTNIEQVQLRKDMFALNIGQIKAVPEGLARTAAQSANDTVVPTLELWNAPETQISALERSVLCNGMTVERVDTLRTFVNNKSLFPEAMENGGCFFQATPIRLSIQDDFHIANIIAQELSKGVYLT